VVQDKLTKIYPRLWRFSLFLTGDKANADDLSQDTALRALDNAEKFRPDTNFDSWVFTIARRIWLNEKRSEKVRRAGGLVSIDQIEIVSIEADPEMNIIIRQLLTEIMALPESQRIVVLMAYVEGYRYREVAEILDIPIGTVMSRLASARKKLSSIEKPKRALVK